MINIVVVLVVCGFFILRKRYEIDRVEEFSSVGKIVNLFFMFVGGKCSEICF